MARFLLAWELGGGMGHVMRLAPIAHALHAQGHALHLVLRDLSGADAALGDLASSPRVTLWQAPMWLPQLRGLPAPAVYAELLFRAGYLDATRLLSLVRAWQALLDAIAPDLLLADHAPTALLAARDHGLPALWPEGDGEPLFAYLKADYPAIDAVLQQLAAAPCRTLAHVPGLDAAQRLRHTSAQLRFSDAAVSMVSATGPPGRVLRGPVSPASAPAHASAWSRRPGRCCSPGARRNPTAGPRA